MARVFRELKQEITFFSTKQLDFPVHMHDDVELVYVRNGSATAACDGVSYRLKKNSFFLVFPNQSHEYVNSHSGEYILLIAKLPTHKRSLRGRPTSAVCPRADAHTTMLLEMALDEYEKKGYTTVVSACLSAFWEKLFTFYQLENDTVSTDTVSRIVHYCHEHYRDDITVRDIAETLHISKSTVSHIFSTQLRVSFPDYIHELRLADAVDMLENETVSITQVAELSGFSTIRTFNRAFRKKYGISPTEYRKNQEQH